MEIGMENFATLVMKKGANDTLRKKSKYQTE